MLHGKQKTTSWLQIYLQIGFVFVFHKSFLFTSMSPEKKNKQFWLSEKGEREYILIYLGKFDSSSCIYT